jgi:hypothetical protein
MEKYQAEDQQEISSSLPDNEKSHHTESDYHIPNGMLKREISPCNSSLFVVQQFSVTFPVSNIVPDQLRLLYEKLFKNKIDEE